MPEYLQMFQFYPSVVFDLEFLNFEPCLPAKLPPLFVIILDLEAPKPYTDLITPDNDPITTVRNHSTTHRQQKEAYLTEINHCARTTDIVGNAIPMTSEEKLVTGVYASVDAAIACSLEKLRSEDGVIASCTPGCCHCCRFFILINVAEARTLVRYIRRNFSPDRIEAVRKKTLQWHEWEHSGPGRYPASGSGRYDSGYEHGCPLLSNGMCSVYPVRPVVCRVHFVSSNPVFCLAANDPESEEDAPAVLLSVAAAAEACARTIRNHIEKSGLDYTRSRMLLPHWLEIEMGWDFHLSI
jgi:Fe-S-cluster containining protein